MANAILPVVANGHSVTISTLSADWVWTSQETGSDIRMLIKEIIFIPGAAGESIVIQRGTDAGQIICTLKSTDGAYLKDLFSIREFNPMIDFSDCSVASGTARVIIRYEIEKLA